MEAIKKVLAPGKAHDDAIMYGDGSTQATQHSSQHVPGAFEDDTQVQGDAPVQPGVSTRHVPGGFDSDVPEGRDVPSTQHVLPGSGRQELGGLNQPTNPVGQQHDSTRYADTTNTTSSSARAPLAQSGAGLSEQRGTHHDLQSSGRYDSSQQYNSSYGNATGTTSQGIAGMRPSGNTSDNGSALSIKSGVLGPYASGADSSFAGQSTNPSTATSTNTGAPYQGTTTDHSTSSHAGRDAALGGLAGTGAAALAHDSSRSHGGGSSTSGNTSSHLSGSSSGVTTSQQPAHGTASSTHAQPSTTSATNFPSTTRTGADNGLSHHVHNGLADIPHRSGHIDHSVASANTLRGAGNSVGESEPVTHISLASAGYSGQGSNTGDGKVYNTVVGKHSEHE